jgi:hypothetical protein
MAECNAASPGETRIVVRGDGRGRGIRNKRVKEGDGWQVIDRVTEAEEALAKAAARLQRAQLEAVLGVRYDDVAYDHAVLEYRRATRELARAAEEGRRWQWRPHQPPSQSASAVA